MDIATVSALICLVVGVADGDTLKLRCGEPGQYEQITVRLVRIPTKEATLSGAKKPPVPIQKGQPMRQLIIERGSTRFAAGADIPSTAINYKFGPIAAIGQWLL